MLNKKMKITTLAVVKIATAATVALGGLYAGSAFAAAPSAIPLSEISGAVGGTVSQLATVLIDIALIAGIGFILASFFKFHQHKQNPQQVQMSQGISLLLIGCGLTLIPLLIPTASVAVLGSSAAKPAQIDGTDINELIGGTGGGSGGGAK